MNDKPRFRVPGKPIGKARARYSKFTDGFYTPTTTKNAERTIGAYAKVCMMENVKKLTNKAMAVNLFIYHKVPASYTKQKTKDALANVIRPIKKPDTDNVLKCVMDALTGVVYEDDNQVVDNIVRRFYAKEWSIEVEFYEV